jgi:cytochrome c peroxidase
VAGTTTANSLGDDIALREQVKAIFKSVNAADEAALHSPIAELGRALFWDERISADGKTSCASCHLVEDYGSDRRTFSPSATGKLTKRNSQTVFNAMLQPALRWTSNRKNGAEQATGSLTGSLGFASKEAAEAKLQEMGYEERFRQAFPDDAMALSATNHGRAIAAYEETLTTPAAFDRFLDGDDDAMTSRQKEGLAVFVQVGCVDCHSGQVLGGERLEKFGVHKEYWSVTGSKNVDLGRFEDTQQKSDEHHFRVAMLRNISKTGPYFHDGSVARLEDAVRVMATVQLGSTLTSEQTMLIVEFLGSLTGAVPEHFRKPQLNPSLGGPLGGV